MNGDGSHIPPHKVHLTAVKRVLCYLSGTKNLLGTFSLLTLILIRPVIVMIDLVHLVLYSHPGAAFCWSNRKQPVFALSTAKSEYNIALSAVT